MSTAPNEHYRGEGGEAYLEQRKSSLTDRVQSLRASLFTDLGDPSATILDFGCGSGGILSRLAAKRRIGVEIGDAAASLARASGVEVHASLREIASASVDVAISFHALEHVDAPVEILSELRRVVRPEGRVRIVVPGELALVPAQRAFRPNRDKHLYTWTPLLLGNLAERAGYRDIEARVVPMPTGNRVVRWLTAATPPLGRLLHHAQSVRNNALNVVLDARP
jgi:2-polyprenyl-3-methyl-5-hydroxy-6-metoxy-1,4-benzoquinol methylase